MSKFTVGQVVIIQSIDYPELNGDEVEIVHVIFDEDRGYKYVVTPDNSGSVAPWLELALKKLPDGDVPAEFDESIFMPEGLKAELK